MADFTPYQQKIIKRYYDNNDSIQRQRLAELVSELYLSSGKKRQRVWESVVSAMQKLGVPQSRIDHLAPRTTPPSSRRSSRNWKPRARPATISADGEQYRRAGQVVRPVGTSFCFSGP